MPACRPGGTIFTATRNWPSKSIGPQVADLLTQFGLEVHTSVGNTGVVGLLKKGDSERALGLRADMDALKIQEQNSFEHRSLNAGKMHACGHDGCSAPRSTSPPRVNSTAPRCSFFSPPRSMATAPGQ
jgi:hypothetical protein